MNGEAALNNGNSGEESLNNQSQKIEYKVPKGTRDLSQQEADLRVHVIKTCENVFRMCDAQPIDTPTFELKSILMEKYGDEASKEIYTLKNDNEDGEQLALRFDQTVPFARYVKSNNITKMRRYQIGKVYRKDQPNMKACRFREFTQCDFDILGNDLVKEVADAETISVLNRILVDLRLTKSYTIRINNREILSSIFDYCKVPPLQFQAVCSSIDKLDKKGWDYVYNEITTDKNLDAEIATKLKQTFLDAKKVDWDTLDTFEYLPEHLVNNLRKFHRYLCLFGCEKVSKLDFTLARGLDYYTGLIFEVELKKGKVAGLGSVAAGGRYDQLCNGIDCVGFALGVDRISTVVPVLSKKSTTIEVKLISPDDNNDGGGGSAENVFAYRMHVMNQFRNQGIRAGTELKIQSNFGTQINKALKAHVPFIAFVGAQEMKNGTVSLKNLETRSQSEMTIEEACNIILASRL